jgi:hypothetical protein
MPRQHVNAAGPVNLDWRLTMTSVPEQPQPEGWANLSPEQRADWHLAQIPDADFDALAAALARLLISAARNEDGPRRTIGKRAAEPSAEGER